MTVTMTDIQQRTHTRIHVQLLYTIEQDRTSMKPEKQV